MKSTTGPTMLIILDGFGHSEKTNYNAIYHAKTPNLDAWFKEYPHAILKASGQAVGILSHSIGTSEVGHLTIGAGRVIAQSVLRIHSAIDDGTFFTNNVLVQRLEELKKSGGALHLFGLLSDAGVHSHEKHLYACLKAARDHGIKKIYIHTFLDGRDVAPRSAEIYLKRLETIMKQQDCCSIASIHGRFYAMDRDNNWERTEQSYRILTEAQTTHVTWKQALQKSYDQNISDEFFVPVQCDPEGIVRDGDGIIFFNFRPDRARQLTRAFTDPSFDKFSTKKLRLSWFISATDYDHNMRNVDVLFEKQPVNDTLKEILSHNGKTIFSIAETEKYAHVTYFFSGGKEYELPGETWKLIPSIPKKDYVNLPHMSAQKITDALITSLKTDPKDFYVVNYANADMVGHSGNFDATVKAIEFLDVQLKRLFDRVVTEMNGTIYITGDHGNAEEMFDEKTGQMRTSHSTNPVPFLVLRNDARRSQQRLSLHELADIAPFILTSMGLPIPDVMKRS